MSRIAQTKPTLPTTIPAPRRESVSAAKRPTGPLPQSATTALDRLTSKLATRVIPMPGRLSVSYRDQYGWVEPKAPLAEVITGSHVTATGMITRVRYLDTTTSGRVMIVLTDDAGDSAHVSLGPDVVRMIQPVLHDGTRLQIRGLVTRTIPSQPAGIDGLGVTVVA